MPSRKTLAWASVAVVGALSFWGWSVAPDRLGTWLFTAGFPPALWAFVEVAQAGDRARERAAILDWYRTCVAWIGLMFLASLGPRLAIAVGALDPGWRPLLRQAWWLAFGISMSVWGNLLPKLMSPWQAEDEPFDWQRVHRFVGWVFTLGGFGVVLAWLALPPQSAKTASTAVVATAAVLGVGRKLVSLASPGRGSDVPPATRGGSR